MTHDWYDPNEPTVEQIIKRIIARVEQLEADVKALHAELRSRTDPRLFTGQ